MEENKRIVVLDEGIEEDLGELANCCKTGAPAPVKTTK